MNGKEDWIQTSLKLNGTSEWKAVSIEPEMFLSNYKHRPQISFTIKETEKKESCHSPSHGGPDLFKSVQSNWKGFRPQNADLCKISVEQGATRGKKRHQGVTRGKERHQGAIRGSKRHQGATKGNKRHQGATRSGDGLRPVTGSNTGTNCDSTASEALRNPNPKGTC